MHPTAWNISGVPFSPLFRNINLFSSSPHIIVSGVHDFTMTAWKSQAARAFWKIVLLSREAALQHHTHIEL